MKTIKHQKKHIRKGINDNKRDSELIQSIKKDSDKRSHMSEGGCSRRRRKKRRFLKKIRKKHNAFCRSIV